MAATGDFSGLLTAQGGITERIFQCLQLQVYLLSLQQ